MTNHTHLCLVLAAPALKGVCLEVSDGNESTKVTQVHPVGVGSVVQPLMKKLSSSMCNLTISLHLTKSEPSITREQYLTQLTKMKELKHKFTNQVH